jgi:hypothetical protein
MVTEAANGRLSGPTMILRHVAARLHPIKEVGEDMLNDNERRPDPEREPVQVVVSTGSNVRGPEQRASNSDSSRGTIRYDTANDESSSAGQPPARRLHEDPEALGQRRYRVGKTIDLVWYALGVLEAVLGLRFILMLTAANPAAGFVSLVYAVSGPFAWWFNGIFRVPREGNAVFDANILIAMAVYALIAWGITRLLAMTIEPPSVS